MKNINGLKFVRAKLKDIAKPSVLKKIADHAKHSICRVNASSSDSDCYVFTMNDSRTDFDGDWYWKVWICEDDIGSYLFDLGNKKFYRIEGGKI